MGAAALSPNVPALSLHDIIHELPDALPGGHGGEVANV